MNDEEIVLWSIVAVLGFVFVVSWWQARVTERKGYDGL